MIVFASLTPSKSMPQTSNHDFRVKCHYIHAGTIEPMRIKNILTKTVFLPYASVLDYNLKLGKEIKMLMVVDTSLHPLII